MTQGRLAENVTHFARVLRAAGLPVGPDRVVTALHAIEAAGLDDRVRVHAALSAVLIDRHEHQAVFDAAFAAFWRDPKLFERLMYLTLPKIQGRGSMEREKRSQRIADALAGTQQPAPPKSAPPPAEEKIDIDTVLTFSDRERLQKADFESMSAEEFALAKKLAERTPLPIPPLVTRRFESSPRGALDLRAMARHGARDPFAGQLAWRRRARRDAPLTVLIDVSGSMQRYSRLFLHWVHALTRARANVAVFTMGTRLTSITRCLKHRDADAAIDAANAVVKDWNGGTRLTTCLAEFNRVHARRVLTGNAAVLLLTDGLERDENGALAEEAARLARMARRIVWLNPLLRYDGFEPRAAGIRAILPHVAAFLPAHNLESLKDLGRALAGSPNRDRRAARHMRSGSTS
ncbi:MAG: vWA domain-containing protein [Burkholderiales bacterium]